MVSGIDVHPSLTAALLSASRALVAVAARSLAAADTEVTLPQYRAMVVLARCQVDLLLAGHFHIAHTGSSTTRFHIPGYSALVVASGTTTSTPGRGQPNSLNAIRTNGPPIGIEC